MNKVGEIREIWRYPVKGMAGESLQVGHLGPQGLKGDRIWAVRDNARREIQSCKFRPELLLCSSRVDPTSPGAVQIIFPDGSTLDGADARSHARVSELIGHASTIEVLRTVVKHGDQNLGVYGETVTGGDIRVGDAVYVSETCSG